MDQNINSYSCQGIRNQRKTEEKEEEEEEEKETLNQSGSPSEWEQAKTDQEKTRKDKRESRLLHEWLEWPFLRYTGIIIINK